MLGAALFLLPFAFFLVFLLKEFVGVAVGQVRILKLLDLNGNEVGLGDG